MSLRAEKALTGASQTVVAAPGSTPTRHSLNILQITITNKDTSAHVVQLNGSGVDFGIPYPVASNGGVVIPFATAMNPRLGLILGYQQYLGAYCSDGAPAASTVNIEVEYGRV